MKSALSVCLFFIFTAFINPLLAQDGHKISIKLKGSSPGDTMVLANYFGDKNYIADSGFVDNKGVAVFEGAESLDQGVYLVVANSAGHSFEIVVPEDQDFYIEVDKNDPSSYLVKGSEQNKRFYEHQNFSGKLNRQSQQEWQGLGEGSTAADTARVQKLIKQNNEKVKEYREEYIKNYPEDVLTVVLNTLREPEVPKTITSDEERYYWFKKNYFANIDFSDERHLRTPVFHNKLETYMEKWAQKNNDSLIADIDRLIEMSSANDRMFQYIVVYLINWVNDSQIMCMDEAYVHIVDNYYSTGKTHWVSDEQRKKLEDWANKMRFNLCGMKGRNLMLEDTTGTVKALDDIDSEFTIVYFYDPGCGHCQKKTPVLKEIYDEHSRDEFEVYGVCIESDRAAWTKFIKDKDLNWMNVWDPYNHTNFRFFYHIYSTPMIYILDRDKNIIAKKLDVTQVVDFMDRYRKQQKNKEEDISESAGADAGAVKINRMKEGVFEMSGSLNGNDYPFVLDATGSSVTINDSEALWLIKQGILSSRDIINGVNMNLAEGKLGEGSTVLLRDVKVGDLQLKDVKATVVKNFYAPIYIGYNSLKNLSNVKINTEKELLLINN